MIIKFGKRLMWGVIFALLLSFITYAVSLADTPQNELGPTDDCVECHEETVVAWQDSMHGQAFANEGFQQEWAAQGAPRDCLRCHTTGFDAETGDYSEEGITCSACHYLGPYSPSHPDQLMFTKFTTESCGECHLETFAEWQESAHGENDMTCTNCHNPHTELIKQESTALLCQSCHTDEGYFYDMTAHAEAELLCTDCHLRVSETPLGEGHAQRHHKFTVDLETCNECHGEDMHFPVSAEAEDNLIMSGTTSTDSTISLLTDAHFVEASPSQNSPFNFALLAALIGLAFGLVGSPIFERLFR